MCSRRNGEEKLQVHKNTHKMNNNHVKVNLLESRFEKMSFESILKQSTFEI